MRLPIASSFLSLLIATSAIGQNQAPDGFTALFNGKDLTGWFGHGTKDPRTLWAMSPDQLKAHQQSTLGDVTAHWRVEDGGTRQRR